MERQFYVLANDQYRQKAVEMIMRADKDSRVEIKPPKRTLDQNAKMHAMLGDIAGQYRWHGLRLHKDSWKLIFLDGLHREMSIVPNLDGTGFVSLTQSSSDLTVAEMSAMIELMYAWGAEPDHPVTWSEPDVWHRGETPSAAKDPAAADNRAGAAADA